MSFKLLPVLVAIALVAAVQGDEWDEITDRVEKCMRLVPYKVFGSMRVTPTVSCVDGVGGVDKSEVTAYMMDCLTNWWYGVKVPPAYTQSELASGKSCLEKEMAKPF